MAFDVHARFTLNARTDGEARATLEWLLSQFLDPTSTTFQIAPHRILDSWALEPEER
jgi:hypothetical protein